MKEIKKYQVIVVLIVIIILMIGLKIKYGVVTYSEDTSGLITPTTRELPTPTEKILDPDYPLLDLLPYPGRGFIVDRYTAPLTLVVKIKGLDRTLVIKEIDEWFEGLGVATESHKIRFEESNLDQKSNIKNQNLN